MSRSEARAQFLAEFGLGNAELTSLPVDASFRRYFRLVEGMRRVLLMDAPPEDEETAPFVTIAGHLVNLGISAPRIFEWDPLQGFVVLEDFGDDTFTRLLAAGEDEVALYRSAIDVLVALHRHPEAVALSLPRYDAGPLLEEAALFVDWYLPVLTGSPAEPSVRAAYLDAWRAVFDALPATPDTLVMRDYHVDNIMRLKGHFGLDAFGVLDFQDALTGPRAYDVVSLLEDARRDIAPERVAELRRHYAQGMGEQMEEVAAFDAWYAVLGAQRHAKVAGIFVRLHQRDGKGDYLRHIPRVVAMLRRHLETAPRLAPVAAWHAEHLPDFDHPLPAALTSD